MTHRSRLFEFPGGLLELRNCYHDEEPDDDPGEDNDEPDDDERAAHEQHCDVRPGGARGVDGAIRGDRLLVAAIPKGRPVEGILRRTASERGGDLPK